MPKNRPTKLRTLPNKQLHVGRFRCPCTAVRRVDWRTIPTEALKLGLYEWLRFTYLSTRSFESSIKIYVGAGTDNLRLSSFFLVRLCPWANGSLGNFRYLFDRAFNLTGAVGGLSLSIAEFYAPTSDLILRVNSRLPIYEKFGITVDLPSLEPGPYLEREAPTERPVENIRLTRGIVVENSASEAWQGQETPDSSFLTITLNNSF